MKNEQLKKEWEKFVSRIFYFTKNIPEYEIGVELKNDEDHFKNNWDTGELDLDREGDYAKASITIYDNNGDLSSCGKSMNLTLTEYLTDPFETDEEKKFGYEQTIDFIDMLYEMVATYWANENNRHITPK